ncbi:flavodoxin [Methanomicrobiaceae archaeon CYW5]|uniref:flavodoxin family protein n=1 Tax=Methanovulcanius yangii TaxID=1789227 RepID=UPI0029CA0CE5|nr:flavodoxin family protein [Methanovulcanius yangii]MBT8508257.1 flavodoxin [Methanovulcanius yangii]
MLVMAFNGSPRKKWNTATMLEHALEGAASRGARTELVHLCDLDYSGCTSCFACKRLGGKSYGTCSVEDDLTPVLERVEESADAVILGTPIYFMAETGMMRNLMERLLFPYLTYSNAPNLFPREMPVALIYTMNMHEDQAGDTFFDARVALNEEIFHSVFGRTESLMSYDTLQFDDYAKYETDIFDAEAKARRRREVFPADCERAYALGDRLVRRP